MTRYEVWCNGNPSTNTIEDWVIKIAEPYLLNVDHWFWAEKNKLSEVLHYVFDCRIEIRERMEGLDLVDCVNSGEFFVMFDDIIKEAYRVQNLARLYPLEEDGSE